jgi:hypothetical protein
VHVKLQGGTTVDPFAGYDHVIPEFVGIVGIGQHPLLLSVVLMEVVYIVLSLGHSLI